MGPVLDLAIVGAGVAGTSVAYRMSQLRPDWSISVFEATQRVGGRLLSPRVPGVEGIRAEFGGMRFRTSQPNFMSLVDELGLDHRPFRTVDDRNTYFLRGARFTAADLGEPDRVPYRLDGQFRGRKPGELLVDVFEIAVPGALGHDAEAWRRVKREHTYKGRLLRDWSLGDLLRDIAGPEGYQWISDGFGYSNVFELRSAADAMPWMMMSSGRRKRTELSSRAWSASRESLAGGSRRRVAASSSGIASWDCRPGAAPARLAPMSSSLPGGRRCAPDASS